MASAHPVLAASPVSHGMKPYSNIGPSLHAHVFLNPFPLRKITARKKYRLRPRGQGLEELNQFTLTKLVL